jgi:hypothetical protein
MAAEPDSTQIATLIAPDPSSAWVVGIVGLDNVGLPAMPAATRRWLSLVEGMFAAEPVPEQTSHCESRRFLRKGVWLSLVHPILTDGK